MIKGALLSPGACESYGSCNSAPYELGQSTSFWVAAGVVTHTLWTGAAPAMTYPLFAEVWHLTHTFTTGIFAIYPIDRRADCLYSATTFPRNAPEQSRFSLSYSLSPLLGLRGRHGMRNEYV